MATGTVIKTTSGKKAFFPTEIIELLKQAKQDYNADLKGMAEGGMCLSSKFTSYCDIQQMQKLMDESGQEYMHDALNYAKIYNLLFSIDI